MPATVLPTRVHEIIVAKLNSVKRGGDLAGSSMTTAGRSNYTGETGHCIGNVDTW